jgi:hypothetical protein
MSSRRTSYWHIGIRSVRIRSDLSIILTSERSNFEDVEYLLHRFSSEPSVQSYLPSQTRFLEMQSPFEQVACCSPQAGGRVGVGIPGYKNVHV